MLHPSQSPKWRAHNWVDGILIEVSDRKMIAESLPDDKQISSFFFLICIDFYWKTLNYPSANWHLFVLLLCNVCVVFIVFRQAELIYLPWVQAGEKRGKFVTVTQRQQFIPSANATNNSES